MTGWMTSWTTATGATTGATAIPPQHWAKAAEANTVAKTAVHTPSIVRWNDMILLTPLLCPHQETRHSFQREFRTSFPERDHRWGPIGPIPPGTIGPGGPGAPGKT